jgi:DNA-binding transcriptional regulator YiaG
MTGHIDPTTNRTIRLAMLFIIDTHVYYGILMEVIMIRCSNCRNGFLQPGQTKDHNIGPLFGFDHVLLTEAPALICDHCGHIALEGEVIETARRKLGEIIVRSREPLTPAEARFLRETIGMTQAQLAERLGLSRVTVTRWETGEDLGAIQSFAIRTLAAFALDGALAQIVSAPEIQPSLPIPKPYRIEQGVYGALAKAAGVH